MPEEIDAEDGEVRELPPPAPEEKRDEKRKPAEDNDRGAGKKHKSDRDRSRSRERTRVDREREREKRISYDQVSYSGDAYDRYDRYAAAAAEARDSKARKERGRDGREPERDDRSRRADFDKDSEIKDREKRREREEADRERERRRERDDKELDRRKERDADAGDKDRRKERDRGKEKERSRSRDRNQARKPADDGAKERDSRRDDGRSKDKNRGKEGSERYDDRHDRKKDRGHGRGRDGPSKDDHGEEPRTPRESHKDGEHASGDGHLLMDDDQDLEIIRQRRAAILEKIKNKAASNISQVPLIPASTSQSRPQVQEDIFEDQKKEETKTEEPTEVKSAAADLEDVDDSDEIETANVFAAKERGGESDEDGQDDMFTNSPARARNGAGKAALQIKEGGEEVDRSGLEEDRVDRRLGDTNADNWDDSEGYFRTRPGELIIGRYLVNRDIGNGVYSTVLSASDQQNGREVAIKIVRSNETMTTAGRKEIEILKKLGAEDPDGRRHICKLLSHFEYKNHLCMVFVPLEMNLRKLLKTYGREVGITLSAIRQYTRQLLIGLAHMVKCKVVHGDIKLDNIVITKDLKHVAICDFGTADWESECVITPYMVSRYYRPPEICLGHRYGYPMDLWSVGVCLFELYTGKFMFTGRNNNDMLKQFMDYKGAPNKKFLRKGQFFDQHFEEEKGQVVFKWITQDKVTKAEIIEKKIYDKPVKSIYEQLRKVRSSSDDAKKVKEFSDLLEQIFILDPLKRISVSEALKHAFLR